MIIKGKLNIFSVSDIHRISPDLDTSDFVSIEPFYDAFEEEMLEHDFVLYDDDIEFIEERLVKGYYEKRYNIAIVRGIKRNDKFIVKDIAIAYHHIKNTKMTDLDKLTYVRNHVRIPTINGIPDEDGLKAWKYLEEYINKMKELGVKNIKELLK